jgi:GT2 family glycosyltransferase
MGYMSTESPTASSEPGRSAQVAVIVVSANSGAWLPSCLSTLFDRAGDISLDVVVVAAGCTDDTLAVVNRFQRVRTITCDNHGFAHANNRALETIDANWVLFLNPDTEFVSGSLESLIADVEPRANLGLVGVKQVLPDGTLYPTIRRFPTATRWLFESLGSERFPFQASWLGERELDLAIYENDVACDWTPGSFMLVRREAIADVGGMDERFFLYCEETDFCLRIARAGWEIRHLPGLTIVHHAIKSHVDIRLEAQAAFSKRLYAEKHFGRARFAAIGALMLGLSMRSVVGPRERRRASRDALAVVLGIKEPPFASLTQPG